jgi:hypothetical protein
MVETNGFYWRQWSRRQWRKIYWADSGACTLTIHIQDGGREATCCCHSCRLQWVTRLHFQSGLSEVRLNDVSMNLISIPCSIRSAAALRVFIKEHNTVLQARWNSTGIIYNVPSYLVPVSLSSIPSILKLPNGNSTRPTPVAARSEAQALKAWTLSYHSFSAHWPIATNKSGTANWWM